MQKCRAPVPPGARSSGSSGRRAGLVPFLGRAAGGCFELLPGPSRCDGEFRTAPFSPNGLVASLIALATVVERMQPFQSVTLRKYEIGSYEEMCAAAPLGGAGALQHRPRRVRQARPRPPGDGLGGLGGNERRVSFGELQELRTASRICWRRWGSSAATAWPPCFRRSRDGGRLPRHLQARCDPALDVRALRRRRHPAPAERLGRARWSRTPRTATASPRGWSSGCS